MKLIVAVLESRDFANLRHDLLENGHPVTLLSSSGGFLKEGNSTVLIGVEENKVSAVLDIIEANCRDNKRVNTPPIFGKKAEGGNLPIELTIGGATVFVLDVEQFIKV
ncbi:cyclic-di-AMP receptor [Proteinivorax hydrogeniformans]|uniref:Cyclic-di-AMP receptor n=1 Tax=Proteinivorax hydrogeniformans TaxID=1826727 RepID=A0AAU8HUP8_9FIRM